LRTLIEELGGSLIREVANAGIGREDVLPFWFGEGDEVTPAFVRQAAADSLARGETFYSHNLGLPELREAIARYTGGLHGAIPAQRVAVTSSGVNGLMLAAQALAGAGDEVVAVVPVWPNLVAQPTIMGAHVKRVSLQPRHGAWRLDLDALLAAVGPRTRMLLVNAPGNPTGWTLGRAEQQAILDHCRRHGTWIVADEVYERLFYGAAACAPSFLDIATPEDRVISVHSFSKSFLMTGWRLGWMVAPAPAIEAIGKLIEFNTSCAPVFVQRAGVAALEGAAQIVPDVVQHLRRCRDTLLPRLAALPGVEVAVPEGGMYAFFRMPGSADSLACAKALVTQAGLGLAPGAAFGSEAQGWLRWCFASREPERLLEGLRRLERWLAL
jgi:aspartate/methionine/tyrosine aminotransferase